MRIYFVEKLASFYSSPSSAGFLAFEATSGGKPLGYMLLTYSWGTAIKMLSYLLMAKSGSS